MMSPESNQPQSDPPVTPADPAGTLPDPAGANVGAGYAQPGGSVPPPPVTPDERVERLSRIVSSKSLEGWIVVDKNDRDASAVLMVPGKPVNHILHFLVGVFTCGLWWIVWVILVLTQKKEQRMRVSIDAYGNLIEETITVS